MFGLVVAAVGALVALNPYAHAIKCDTIGHMMMIGGVLIVLDGALAMWGACTERVWVVKTVRGGGGREVYAYACSFVTWL